MKLVFSALLVMMITTTVILTGVNVKAATTEERTFADCYEESVNKLVLEAKSISYELNFDDPKMQTYLINVCNFYHEKTGEWINALGYMANLTNPELTKEFYNKYPGILPKQILDLRQNIMMKNIQERSTN